MEREKFLSAIYLIIKNEKGEILFQRRQGTKLWPLYLGLPAGHVDISEDVYETVTREAREELGIEISERDLGDTFVVNRRNKSIDPYFDVYFVVDNYRGEIEIKEPNKCQELVWARMDKLPEDVIPFERTAIENYRRGINFSVVYANNEKELTRKKTK